MGNWFQWVNSPKQYRNHKSDDSPVLLLVVCQHKKAVKNQILFEHRERVVCLLGNFRFDISDSVGVRYDNELAHICGR